MEKRVSITTAATTEPVDAAYIKLHCRIDIDDDDTWIAQRITAARIWCEKFTGKTFANTAYILKCPNWKDDSEEYLVLPKGPVNTLDTVAYRDSSGTLTQHDVDEFELDTDDSGSTRLRFKYGKTIPQIADAWDAVQIDYIAGPATGDETNVDERVRQAIALVVGHWYKNRETSTLDIPEHVQSSARGLLLDLCATEC